MSNGYQKPPSARRSRTRDWRVIATTGTWRSARLRQLQVDRPDRCAFGQLVCTAWTGERGLPPYPPCRSTSTERRNSMGTQELWCSCSNGRSASGSVRRR
jgi:hypothetical protein